MLIITQFDVILLFVKTVLYQLPLRLRLRLRLPQYYELFGDNKGEASILKIYLQDKFRMENNLVNLV
jgi:hypothetical protein